MDPAIQGNLFLQSFKSTHFVSETLTYPKCLPWLAWGTGPGDRAHAGTHDSTKFVNWA